MEKRYKKMKGSSASNIALLILYGIFSNSLFSNCSSSVEDDRLVPVPSQDSILEEMIQKCKDFTYSRPINPYFDTTIYYVTFIFHTFNDSVTVDAMGAFDSPYIFHDKESQYSLFRGYFLRENTYCFFYETLNHENHISAIDKLMDGWRKRDPEENMELFPDLVADQDPVSFCYYIDSVGKYHFIRRVRW